MNFEYLRPLFDSTQVGEVPISIMEVMISQGWLTALRKVSGRQGRNIAGPARSSDSCWVGYDLLLLGPRPSRARPTWAQAYSGLVGQTHCYKV